MKIIFDTKKIRELADYIVYNNNTLFSFIDKVKKREEWINTIPEGIGDKESIKELIGEDKSLEDEFYNIICIKLDLGLDLYGERIEGTIDD